MTRHPGYVVVLENDVRKDDAELIINALRMVRGVVSVEPIIGNYDQAIADSRARYDLLNRLAREASEIRKERSDG